MSNRDGAARRTHPKGEDIVRPGGKPSEAGRNALPSESHLGVTARKGFLKESWQANRQRPGALSIALKAGKSKIDDLLFIQPRHVILRLPPGGVEGVLERPLRAETARGPRVALAASEMLPAGTWCDVRITVLAPQIITEPLLHEWLDYGRWLGMGQWRSGSYGRFKYTLKPYVPSAQA